MRYCCRRCQPCLWTGTLPSECSSPCDPALRQTRLAQTSNHRPFHLNMGHGKVEERPINNLDSTNQQLVRPTFENRFFCFPHLLQPVINLPGDPFPKHPFHPIMKREVELALARTSNKSTPSPSSIGYKLVKWAFAAHPNFILDIFNATLCLGHHLWTIAKIVILPKPNKLDYSMVKAYWPVSLLECFSKTLEKIVANHFTSDSNLHDILPPSQFDSRPYHLATDACSLLRYKADMTTKSGRIGSVLLFDILRFFDHLDPTFITHVLHHLGIDDHMIAWVSNFMKWHTITMEFNNHMMELLEPDLGTPQGSPLLPILSALVMGPILCLAETWDNSDMTLYFNNGSIFTSGPTYNAIANKPTREANCAFSWLQDSGFSVNPNKCEVMFFCPQSTRGNQYRTAPATITVCLTKDTTMAIKPAMSL
jgi:hypothetical protein